MIRDCCCFGTLNECPAVSINCTHTRAQRWNLARQRCTRIVQAAQLKGAHKFLPMNRTSKSRAQQDDDTGGVLASGAVPAVNALLSVPPG